MDRVTRNNPFYTPYVRHDELGTADLSENPSITEIQDAIALKHDSMTPVAANDDTAGATITELEAEVNELKAALRSLGLMLT